MNDLAIVWTDHYGNPHGTSVNISYGEEADMGGVSIEEHLRLPHSIGMVGEEAGDCRIQRFDTFYMDTEHCVLADMGGVIKLHYLGWVTGTSGGCIFGDRIGQLLIPVVQVNRGDQIVRGGQSRLPGGLPLLWV